MVPIKEALTFDDVTLVPKYSEICLLYTSDAADE